MHKSTVPIRIFVSLITCCMQSQESTNATSTSVQATTVIDAGLASRLDVASKLQETAQREIEELESLRESELDGVKAANEAEVERLLMQIRAVTAEREEQDRQLAEMKLLAEKSSTTSTAADHQVCVCHPTPSL